MKYLLIFLSSFIVFAVNAAPEPKDVNVVNIPDVTIVNTSADPIPTVVESLPTRNLVHDGQAFSLDPNPNIAFEFAVPSDVVLTDVVLSLNSSSIATTVFVSEGSGSKTYVFQSVGSGTSTFAGSNEGQLSIHFESGLNSPNGLRVGLYCNNIGGNSCSGALMWSGYQL